LTESADATICPFTGGEPKPETLPNPLIPFNKKLMGALKAAISLLHRLNRRDGAYGAAHLTDTL
jgi:hypothetical protein